MTRSSSTPAEVTSVETLLSNAYQRTLNMLAYVDQQILSLCNPENSLPAIDVSPRDFRVLLQNVQDLQNDLFSFAEKIETLRTHQSTPSPEEKLKVLHQLLQGFSD